MIHSRVLCEHFLARILYKKQSSDVFGHLGAKLKILTGSLTLMYGRKVSYYKTSFLWSFEYDLIELLCSLNFLFWIAIHLWLKVLILVPLWWYVNLLLSAFLSYLHFFLLYSFEFHKTGQCTILKIFVATLFYSFFK